MSEARYMYAVSLSGATVHISELTSENRGEAFACVSCARGLIPKLGQKRIHHFAHRSKEEAQVCSYETYLHKLGKLRLATRLNDLLRDGLPFAAEIFGMLVTKDRFGNEKQELTTHRGDFNLLENCDRISVEQYVDELRPDISLAYADGQVVFLEIVVTHKSSQEKIAGNQVIDIFIADEKDIDRACAHLVENPDRFYGFESRRTVTERFVTGTVKPITLQSMSHGQRRQVLSRYRQCFTAGTLRLAVNYSASDLSRFLGFKVTGVTDAPDRTARFLLSDFYTTCELVDTPEVCALILRSDTHSKRFFIGFYAQRNAFVTPTDPYVLLREMPSLGNCVHQSEANASNLHLDRLMLVPDDWTVRVNCFYPKGSSGSTIMTFTLAELRSRSAAQKLEVFAIELISRIPQGNEG